jgi:hypothetical protein
MRSYFLFLCIAFCFSSTIFSQAYEGTIEYDKRKQQAFVIDYPYPPEAVENALIKKMELMGYKGKAEKGMFNKDKGFRVYKDAFVTDISEGSMDYVFKIESKSRKEDDKSVIYMVILDKDGANAKLLFAAEGVAKAKSFLNNLQPMMEEAGLELEIRNQEEGVTKAEKKLKDLKDDKESMEKKIKKLEEDIKDNIKEQEDLLKAIENQKKILEVMRGKRKNS